MGTKVRYAEWRRDGRLFRVKPPDWPKGAEYSCTSQEALIEWARNHNYMLRQGSTTRREPA